MVYESWCYLPQPTTVSMCNHYIWLKNRIVPFADIYNWTRNIFVSNSQLHETVGSPVKIFDSCKIFGRADIPQTIRVEHYLRLNNHIVPFADIQFSDFKSCIILAESCENVWLCSHTTCSLIFLDFRSLVSLKIPVHNCSETISMVLRL